MLQCHTIIVGGGPGGLACAAELARNGKKVLLVERKQHLGAKICAGGVTWSGLGSKLPQELIERAFPTQKISSPWQTATVRSPTPIISTVNRKKLGEYMTAKAKDAGATIISGVTVKSIHNQYIETTAGKFNYKFLVGADGSNSLVRRFLEIPTKNIGIGINCQTKKTFPDMEWCLDSNLFGCGYAWIFPHKDSTSIGAYVDKRTMNGGNLLKQFREWCKRREIEIEDCKPKAAPINYDYRGYRFENRFLIGDAAGLASGLTGEGIYPAILSGETVAKIIVEPNANTDNLDRLIKKQNRHQRFLTCIGRSRLCSKLCGETIIMGLRTGLIPPSALEMG